MSDERQWQEKDLAERFTRSVVILSEASTRALSEDEILFLASELGLSKRDIEHTFKQEMKHAANW